MLANATAAPPSGEGEALKGVHGVLDLLLRIMKLVWSAISKLYQFLFIYPLDMTCSSQYETEVGYLLEANVRARRNRPIYVPKSAFSVVVNKDKRSVKRLNETDRQTVMFGEHAEVFESEQVLKARVNGMSFGNVPNYVTVGPDTTPLWILIRVGGPKSQNPSSRFRFVRFYVSVTVRLRKRWFSLGYAEFPLPKVSIIAGNEKTKIIEK